MSAPAINFPVVDERVKTWAAELRAAGEYVSPDYRVKEHVAERLLGLRPGTLKKRRSPSRARPGKVMFPQPQSNGRSWSYFLAQCLPIPFDPAA